MKVRCYYKLPDEPRKNVVVSDINKVKGGFWITRYGSFTTDPHCYAMWIAPSRILCCSIVTQGPGNI